ncbi:protein DEK isoform X1 [Rhizophagus clarus]|uniref:Protein DEK isoform X1 n=1 Tax=Rhizophagus clarus TaxID=94130 RepID=A0A8H3LA75_9GLOM|nr:protein DEK isoform X1 [Rhizophagus clarus]
MVQVFLDFFDFFFSIPIIWILIPKWCFASEGRASDIFVQLHILRINDRCLQKMASQAQEIVQVANNATDNASVTMESNSLAQRHWQELIAATEIAAAQLKEENAQDTKVSGINDNTSMRSLEEQNSFPIGINFTQQAQDDGQTSVIIFESSYLAKPKTEITTYREKKYDEDLIIKEDLRRITAQTKSERKRRQAFIKKSDISKIQATENTGEASRVSKKRKAESESYIYAKEKVEVSESTTKTGKRQGYFRSEMPPSQIDEQENNEAKVIKNSFNEDATTKRRKQATDKLEVAPIRRPRRSIRPVVPYGSEVVEQKVRNKKLIEISQGSGLPLGQIPHVLRAIDKMKTSNDVLKGLHKLIYGRMGSKHDIKNHIRAFSGFKIQTPLDEIVLKEKLEKWKIAGLKEMCYLFGLKSSGDKQKIVDRIYDFLKNPRDMTAPNEENGKGKSNNKKKLADKVKTIVARKKTAKDVFNSEQRLVYKEKAENHSKTRAEIDSLLTEAWRSLTENDKKSYIEKAAEINRNEPQQKRQNLSKNKAKQPEMVEDSDLSGEGFEELVDKIEEHKEERSQNAYVMNSNLDFSDLSSDNKNNDTNIKENNVVSNSCKSEVHAKMKCS